MSRHRSLNTLEGRCFINEFFLDSMGVKNRYINPINSAKIIPEVKQFLMQHQNALTAGILKKAVKEEQNPTVYTGTGGLAYTFIRLAYLSYGVLKNEKRLGKQNIEVPVPKQPDNVNMIKGAAEKIEVYNLLQGAGKYFDKQHSKAFEKLFKEEDIKPSIMCGLGGHYYVRAIYHLLLAKFEEENMMCLDINSNECDLQQYFEKRMKAYEASWRFRELYVELVNKALDDCCSDEWLYGRAGYLYGLLSLRHFMERLDLYEIVVVYSETNDGPMRTRSKEKEIKLKEQLTDAIKNVIDKIIYSGEMYSAQHKFKDCPLMYEWYNDKYVGGAHGLVGILYILLCSIEVTTNPRYMELCRKSAEYILSLETKNMNYPIVFDEPENDYLMQFCHGATAVIFLFHKCAEIFKDKKWELAAIRGSTQIWQYGLLKKGVSLCHGIAGNGYALLATYRATGDELWLNRAIHFALKTADTQVRNTSLPDHPYSLFEGDAGATLFIADLLNEPQNSRFPFFELGLI